MKPHLSFWGELPAILYPYILSLSLLGTTMAAEWTDINVQDTCGDVGEYEVVILEAFVHPRHWYALYWAQDTGFGLFWIPFDFINVGNTIRYTTSFCTEDLETDPGKPVFFALEDWGTLDAGVK